MATKVFLLGRPGSGKTTAFQYFRTKAESYKLPVIRFREYTILYKMFQEKREEFQAAEHGGFDIRDFSILEKSAQELEQGIREYIRQNERRNELIFIELARSEYQHTLHKCFKPDFLQDSYFLLIEADIEKCIQRIHYRVAHPAETDGHFVSEHVLRGYYAKSNEEYMYTHFRKEYNIQKEIMVIKNNKSYNEFCEKLAPFADTVLAASQGTAPANQPMYMEKARCL